MSKKKNSSKKVLKTSRLKKILPRTKAPLKYFSGVIFIVLSVLFLYGFPQVNSPQKSSIVIDEKLFSSINSGNAPIHIFIPKVHINLPIVRAPIVNGYWALSDISASYGEGSAGVGEKGNMVVFAHAKPDLFYNLKDIKAGNSIYILTKNTWRQYKVTYITTVYPTETKVIKQTKSELLTLYTCSGFYDEKRLIVQAKPILK